MRPFNSIFLFFFTNYNYFKVKIITCLQLWKVTLVFYIWELLLQKLDWKSVFVVMNWNNKLKIWIKKRHYYYFLYFLNLLEYLFILFFIRDLTYENLVYFQVLEKAFFSNLHNRFLHQTQFLHSLIYCIIYISFDYYFHFAVAKAEIVLIFNFLS